jgi:O-antigen ligase
VTEEPSRSEGLLTAGVEGLLLALLFAAPWAYGGAPDAARYGLVGMLLLGEAVWIADRARTGRPWPALTRPVLGLPALALVQAVTGLSASPVDTLEAFLVLMAMMGALLFWSERGSHRSAARRLAVVLIAVCIAQAGFGALQWSRSPDTIYGRASAIVTMPFGSFVDHNHFAGLMSLGALLSLGMAVGQARRARTVGPASVALAGIGLGLVATQFASRSRGGLLALAGGLVLLVLISTVTRRSSARRAYVAITVLALLVLGFGLLAVPGAARARLATLFEGGRDSSGSYRLDMASATVRLALAHPVVGSGLGAYADAVPPFKRGHGDVRTTHAESDVLEFLAEGGLLGVLLALALGRRLRARVSDRLRHVPDGLRKGMAIGALSAAGALLVHSAFDFNLRLPANALAFVSLVGLAAAGLHRLEGPGEGAPVRRWTGIAAAVGLGLLGLASLGRAEGALAFDRALARPMGEQRLAALDRLLARHPYLAAGWRERGLIWREMGWGQGGIGASRLLRADTDLRRAVALRPQWAEAWVDLAWTLFGRGEPAAARAAADHAATLDPTHLALRLSRAELLARLDGPPAGIAELAQIRRGGPGLTFDRALAVALAWTHDADLLAALAGTAEEREALRRRLPAR